MELQYEWPQVGTFTATSAERESVCPTNVHMSSLALLLVLLSYWFLNLVIFSLERNLH